MQSPKVQRPLKPAELMEMCQLGSKSDTTLLNLDLHWNPLKEKYQDVSQEFLAHIDDPQMEQLMEVWNSADELDGLQSPKANSIERAVAPQDKTPKKHGETKIPR